jgi:carboxypeptidase Taq
LPRGGVGYRAEQMALLAGLLHDRATDPRLGELLDELEGSELVRDPEAPPAVNVRQLRREYERRTRLPRSLVEEVARLTSVAQQEWAVARQNDALLDEYEPGAKSRDIALLFDGLRRELVPLVAAVQGSPRKAHVAVLRREYPLDRQRIFGEAVAAAVGFDFRRGRLDTSVHPFCSGVGPDDCRITTRYALHHFSDAFFSILHEVGHGLYEQGLDPAYHGTPLGEAASLGLHESQARLWENTVGRSRPFWEHFFPRARQVFHEALGDVTADEFYRAVNHVEPSFNRVQADEVTYNLHILIRFELEQALVSGDLPAADLPGAWNQAYRHYLGVTPPNDTEGCLQDGHWGSGLIGYFPTYTLGNLFAAQLYERAGADLGDLDRQVACGELGGLLGWLREKVHRQGLRYSSARLIEQATGAPPDPRPLVQALRGKYGELYGV